MKTALMCSVALLALASAPGCGKAPPAQTAPASYDVLTKDQIDNQGFTTAMDAVQNLRANWLHERGTRSFYAPDSIKVYLDDTRLGGIDQLALIPISNIVYIRHFDGVAATARWGVDHGAGVIYVSTHTLMYPF